MVQSTLYNFHSAIYRNIGESHMNKNNPVIMNKVLFLGLGVERIIVQIC
jgi:hypothetical protein